MKNKLTDLNNHLFAQLERLGDEDLTEDALAHEVSRTDAIAKIAGQIVDVAHIAIQASKLVSEAGGNYQQMLPMISGADKMNEDHPALAASKVKKP